MNQNEKNFMLTKAILSDNLRGIKMALELGADPNTKNHRATRDIYQRPLTYACWHGQYETVKLLLDAGADVNRRTDQGNTPLMLASIQGYARIIAMLLRMKHRANVNITDETGQTPLHKAMWRDSAWIVKMLIRRGANLNAQSGTGKTPLMQGVTLGLTMSMKILIEAGANLDIADYYGNTVFIHAASQGEINAMTILLEAGADIEIRNHLGRTALDILKDRHPDQYELFMRQQILSHEDMASACNTLCDPDFNI